MAKRTIRVYKSDGNWIAKKDGSTKASAVKRTQRDAYLIAKDIALNQNLTITVYHPTGGIKAVINPKNKQEEESGCFITTSCVKYYGLDDDCYELQTLRHFRDTYLLNDRSGQNLVKQYYRVAPALVQKLESDKNKRILFANVFSQIQIACIAIEKKEFETAKNIYIQVISQLFGYFK